MVVISGGLLHPKTMFLFSRSLGLLMSLDSTKSNTLERASREMGLSTPISISLMVLPPAT